MFQTSRFKAAFLSIVMGFLTWKSEAQAPLPINGVTDRQVISGTVTINVPSTTGYTYFALLDGEPIPTDINHVVSRMDYHEVSVTRTNVSTGAVSNRLVRFIVRSTNRGSPETGLIEWLPYPTIDSTAPEFSGAQLNVITPEDYPLGLEIPVVAWVENAQGKAVRANATMTAPGQPSIRIRRGVGSGFLPAASAAGSLEYAATVPGLPGNKTINIEPATTWTSVAGTLNGAVTWANNSRISVTSSITIAPGSSLTVGEGSIVRLNPGVEVFVRGQLTVNGTSQRPVVFTPLSRTQPWGGIITTSAFPARIDATGAFFVRSGANPTWFSGKGYDTHLSQQACFVLDGATGNFTNCFFMDGAGQVGHGRNSNLTLEHSLAQRFLTGGEYVGGTIILNRSAFIEFPQEDGIVNPTIADADNDAIYFTTGTHILTDSLIGWCKDDAVDSGSGGAGTVVVSNCWVESALHEALAWSGSGRQTWTYDTVLINSGQGIECGWSGNANSPLCYAGRLLSLGNSVGARYGDNYEGTSGLGLKDGFLTVTNSLILHNYRDVWGQPWDGTWNYRVADMDIHDNRITTANSFHPNNTLWNPATDGGLLAPFMSTPPNAAVGIGLAVWTNQFAMNAIFQGVPVRLSSFTTHDVTINYAFESGSTTLATGALTFTPGETVKRIYPAGFDLAALTSVRVVLSNPAGGELTGLSNVTFQGTVPAPQVSLGVPVSLLPGYRILEGTFVRLSAPSAQAVSVPYTYRGDGQVVSTGDLVFNPLETSKQLVLTTANPFDYSGIEVLLGPPSGATLSGITSVTYTNPPLIVSFSVPSSQVNLTLLSNGVPVGLNGPASSGVSVDFKIEGTGGILTNGTLVFNPGEGLKLLTAPSINLAQHQLLRATLSNPTGAELGSPSNIYLVRVIAAPSGTNTTLIARGAIWKYRDLASDPGATWRNTNYNDGGWSSGPAQLGFSYSDPEGDEATPIADNDQITSYFRRTFNVANPAAFTNLALWLLRDDAGVVHLNGREVFRSPNLPAFPAAIGYSTTSLAPNGENTIDTATIAATNLLAGMNWAAVEIHQQGPTSSDVSFDFELIGNAAPLPPPPQNVYFGFFSPGQLTIAWGDASFRLERTDELNGASTVWTPVNGPSPITVSYDQPQRFYRITRP